MPAPTTRIAIIGQGVMGLTCASRLLDAGHTVDIYSREELPDTTSMAAGAYWWPHKAYPEERVSKWAKETWDEYAKSRHDPESGIHFETHYRFCLDPDDSAYALDLVGEWEDIDGASHGVACREAYRVVLPVIDVPVFLPRLRDEVGERGARFHLRELESPAELFPGHDLVVNCSGVGARDLVGDPEVYPIRGQVVRVSRPEGLRDSTRLYSADDRFTLVLPRRDDVVLGGTAGEEDWDRTSREEDTDAIFRRCSELVPRIAEAEILGTAVGLRPGRREVRLETEWLAPDRPVIHNYGHGGGGYTVAWGCATEVAAAAAAAVSSE